MDHFQRAQDALLLLLRTDEDVVVGAATGFPLKDAQPEFQAPFLKTWKNVDAYFYLGEFIIKTAYRGHGMGTQLFRICESFARQRGCYEALCFCAIERDQDDPRRPESYRDIQPLYKRAGFTRQAELSDIYTWIDVGDEVPSDKIMCFWTKPLQQASDTVKGSQFGRSA